MVVIIDHDEVAQLQMTRSASSFAGNTLHGTTISEETVGVVVYNVESGLVEGSCGLSLCNGKPDGVSKALTERTSGNFNAWDFVCLGVTRSFAVDVLDS